MLFRELCFPKLTQLEALVDYVNSRNCDEHCNTHPHVKFLTQYQCAKDHCDNWIDIGVQRHDCHRQLFHCIGITAVGGHRTEQDQIDQRVCCITCPLQV